MTWTSGLKLTVLLGYGATRLFYPENATLSRLLLVAYCTLLGFIAFNLLRLYRQHGSLKKAFAESLRQQLGDRVSRYVLFEAKIMYGAIKFLFTPLRSLRRASQSYFVQSSDRAFFWALLFLMVAEPVMLHIVIENMASTQARIYVHTAFTMLEIYGLGFIFGNIYYLDKSRVVLGEEGIAIKLGEVWLLPTNLSHLKKAEFETVRGLDCKVTKIALSSGPYTRLYFHRPILARFLFFEKSLDVVDVYLRPDDVGFLKESLARIN